MRDLEVTAALLASSSWDKMAQYCQDHEQAQRDLDAAVLLHALVPSPYTEIVVHAAAGTLRRAEKRLV